jgi:antibiotic biosynthesis monooxygenase (ABM) superfamily enzyme
MAHVIENFDTKYPQDKRKAYVLEGVFFEENRKNAIFFIDELKSRMNHVKGFLGAKAFFIRGKGKVRAILVVDFTDFSALEIWYYSSDMKNKDISEAKECFITIEETIISGDESVELSDLEKDKDNDRHKMAFLTWLGLYPAINLLILGLNGWTKNLPQSASTLIITILAVILMSYFIMPALKKIFSRWLQAT